MVRIEKLCIDLDNTFRCGQTFRWKRQEDGSWLGNVDGHAVRAVREGDDLCLYGAQEADAAYWRKYFDADSDYEKLLSCVMDEHLRTAMDACPGIRVLDQPFYESLCSFIISANNNIPRITAIVERFCAIAPMDENGLHAFPTPQMVLDAGEDWVKSIGSGYRAKYLWEAAQHMADGFDAQALRNMSYPEACECIRQFKGVGEKVADCVLLFSCGHRAAFPVDTWSEKMLMQWYGMMGKRPQLKVQAMEHFGAYGGIAQQYLFYHAMQSKLKKENNEK